MQNPNIRMLLVLLAVVLAVVVPTNRKSQAERSVVRQEIQVETAERAANPSSEKIIVATTNQVLLLDRVSKAILWESGGLRGAHCVAPLSEGGFLVGEGKSIAQLDKDGRLVSRASISFSSTTDVKSLGDGKMLVCDGPARTVTEMDWEGNIKWSVRKLHWPSEAERLANGNTLVADGTAQLKEFDASGKLVQVIALQRWAASMQRTEDGTVVGESLAVELLDHTGRVIWSHPRSGRVTGVQRLPSGEYLISEPDDNRIAILDAYGNVTWEVTGLGHPAQAIYLR